MRRAARGWSLPCGVRGPERPGPESGRSGFAVSCLLLDDLDDAFHAEQGVLAVVLGVHEAGQDPVAGAVVDDELLVCAPAQDVVEGVGAGKQAALLPRLVRLQQPGDLTRARKAPG